MITFRDTSRILRPASRHPTDERRRRTTHQEAHPATQTGIQIDLFRTGTVLRADRWLPATAVIVWALSGAFPREAAEASAAETFAVYAKPGAIGASRQPQPGPRPESILPDAVQPVEISGPPGMLVSIETASGWSPLRPAPLRMGLVVGAGYRLRIGGIRGRDGEEVYPSVRLLAKLATPPGMAWRFPVEVAVDEADLRAALDGALVRRIVYTACDAEHCDVVPATWFDVQPGDDALEVARTLGEPVAEVVIGNRVPAAGAAP
jgi:hypothetical protein